MRKICFSINFSQFFFCSVSLSLALALCWFRSRRFTLIISFSQCEHHQSFSCIYTNFKYTREHFMNNEYVKYAKIHHNSLVFLLLFGFCCCTLKICVFLSRSIFLIFFFENSQGAIKYTNSTGFIQKISPRTHGKAFSLFLTRVFLVISQWHSTTQWA